MICKLYQDRDVWLVLFATELLSAWKGTAQMGISQ